MSRDRARIGFAADPVTRNPRGKDADEFPETITGARGLGVRPDPGRSGAGRGAAKRAVPARADPAATGAVPAGGPGLRALPARVFRLSSDVLAAVPGGVGLSESRGAQRRAGVPEAAPRPATGHSPARRGWRG